MATKPATPGTGFRGPIYVLDKDGEATEIAAADIGTDLETDASGDPKLWSATQIRAEIARQIAIEHP